MPIEETLVLIKPDGMERRLAGLALDRLEHSGLELVGAKVVSVTDQLAREHYALLKNESYYENAVKFIKGDYHNVSNRRVIALVYRGENAIKAVRAVVGATNPESAAAGTIRSSFGRINTKEGYYENVVHASGNPSEAEREVKIWFKPGELVE
ncbi:MAG TPA: nucleoside-diphosphate kinase [Elusimicrobiales bacterium]|nr:nucleoside-diphosphate kinase [Elusimicrobiales bacterium]